MAVAWKKVLTEGSTVTVPNGGTGQTTLTNGAVLIGDGVNPIDEVILGNDQILMGHTTGSSGSNPVAVSVGTNTDAQITCNDTSYFITILSDAVEGSMVLDGDLEWTTHEKTVVENALKVPYYAKNTGVADLSAAATTPGQVLQYDGTELVWGSNTASNLAIDDESTQNKVYNIGFGETNGDGTAGLTSGNTDFNVSSHFTINPNLNSNNQTVVKLRTTDDIGEGINGIILQADTTEATNIIQCTNFYGLATSTQKVQTAAAGSATTVDLGFYDQADTTNANSTGKVARTYTGFNVSIDGAGVGTLNVPNLKVSGTTTTVNTTELTIEDASIRIADGDVSSTDNDIVLAGEVGVIVGFNDNADVQMPRFVYKGYQDSVSVLGWRIARSANNDASIEATAYGVGVMHVDGSTLSTTGGASSLSIGIGAMALDTAGDLWIQTGV